MAGKTYVAPRGGVLVEEYPLQESLGPASAGGLVALGSDGLIDQSMLPASGGEGGKMVVPKKQLFTANGSWVKPEGFVEGTLTATGIGGGAGGPRNDSTAGTGYSGGNAGQWVYQTPIDVSDITIGLTVPVTIGNGGAAIGNGNTAIAGNSGSPTSFGAKLVLAGAVGGPATTGRGDSVGGALGGVRSDTATAHLTAQSNNCAIGAPLNMRSATSHLLPDGAPGIILDASGIKGGDSSNGSGGLGYGAGGAGNSRAATGAGAKGALLLEWWEVVE